MKQQPPLSLQLRRQSGTALFLRCCLLLAFYSFQLYFSGTCAHAAEISDGVIKVELTDQNVNEALQLLETQIKNTRGKIPDALTKEFESSVVARLVLMQEDVRENIIAEYKRAVIASRIVELAEHILTLPYRQIPESAKERDKAKQQYAAVLDRFEEMARKRVMHLDSLSSNIITGAFRNSLTNVQHDIFRLGYGRPLTQQERTDLDRLVDRVLQAAAGLPAPEQKGFRPSRMREASKVARDARNAMLDFLRDREARLGIVPSMRAAIEAWRKENIALIEAISQAVRNTTKAETDAVIERARKQGEEDVRQNDPANIRQPFPIDKT